MVAWKDAESNNDWEDIEQIEDWAKKDCIINEIGWLVFKNDKYTIISNQISYDNQAGNKTKIPSGWIVKLQKISITK